MDTKSESTSKPLNNRQKSVITGINSTYKTIEFCDFKNSSFQKTVFQSCKFDHIKFSHSKIIECDFLALEQNGKKIHTLMYDVFFKKVAFDKVKFEGLVLDRGNFKLAEFLDSNFNISTFENAIFTEAHFIGVVFHQVTFKNVDFSKAKFENCTFEGCKFESVNFNGAHFKGVKFKDSKFNYQNNFSNTFLKQVTFLNTVNIPIDDSYCLSPDEISNLYDGKLIVLMQRELETLIKGRQLILTSENIIPIATGIIRLPRGAKINLVEDVLYISARLEIPFTNAEVKSIEIIDSPNFLEIPEFMRYFNGKQENNIPDSVQSINIYRIVNRMKLVESIINHSYWGPKKHFVFIQLEELCKPAIVIMNDTEKSQMEKSEEIVSLWKSIQSLANDSLQSNRVSHFGLLTENCESFLYAIINEEFFATKSEKVSDKPTIKKDLAEFLRSLDVLSPPRQEACLIM